MLNIDRDHAWKFAHEWLDAWNKHDINLIMQHYADSIEFCSPIVTQVLGDPKGVVTGIDNLRDYFSRQLQRGVWILYNRCWPCLADGTLCGKFDMIFPRRDVASQRCFVTVVCVS